MSRLDDYLAVDVKTAAEVTCTDEHFWYGLVKGGGIPAIRTSKNRIILRTERIREWLLKTELEQNPQLAEGTEEESSPTQ